MRRAFVVVAFVLALSPQHARAQSPSPATQALTACITSSTTSEDNVTLLQWMFMAMARHPSVVELAQIPDAERVATNRRMGALFNRLLLEACPDEMRAAFAADGAEALRAPFSTFGERAMTDIMNHPDVNAAIAEMGSYVDEQALAAMLQKTP